MSKYWSSLKHDGIVLCNAYESHKTPVVFQKKKYVLHPIAEEIFSMLKDKKDMLKHDHMFQNNIKRSLSKYLPLELKKADLNDIDFSTFPEYRPMYPKSHQPDITINGIDYEFEGSIYVEPPSIFIGRGEHPMRGTYKHRIKESDVTLNMSRCHFQHFKKHAYNLIENKNVLWFASWKDKLTNEYKYLFLPKKFYSNDISKFELARQLKSNLPSLLRKNKLNMLKNDVKMTQCAVALYLIYILGIRVGNEKDTSFESETFGCCSLQKRHISFVRKNVIRVCFRGKDSIEFNKISWNRCSCKIRIIYIREQAVQSMAKFMKHCNYFIKGH